MFSPGEEVTNHGREPEVESGRNGLSLGIISAGRVGAVLGNVLRSVGYDVNGIHAPSAQSIERAELLLPGVPLLPAIEVARSADVVLLSVPDDVLEEVVGTLAVPGAWRPGQLVIHTAGRFGTGVLAAASRLGAIPMAIHPAMTFSGTGLDVGRIAGAAFAISAPGIAVPLAAALVEEIGGKPVIIAEGDRALYHAALAHGSNHGAVLVAQAARALVEAGVPDPMAVLGPLVTASVDGVLRSGEAALTGPIVRGDRGTVAAHLEVLRELGSTHPENSDIHASYRSMGEFTVGRAVSTGRLDADRGAAMLDLLANNEI